MQGGEKNVSSIHQGTQYTNMLCRMIEKVTGKL